MTHVRPRESFQAFVFLSRTLHYLCDICEVVLHYSEVVLQETSDANLKSNSIYPAVLPKMITLIF